MEHRKSGGLVLADCGKLRQTVLPVGIAAVHKESAAVRFDKADIRTSEHGSKKTCVIGAALTKQWAKYTGRKAVLLLFQNGVNRIKRYPFTGKQAPFAIGG